MLDPKGWQPVLTDSYRPLSYSDSLAAEVVCAEPSGRLVYEREMAKWRWPVWAVAMEDVLASNPDTDFRRERVFSSNAHREGPPVSKSVQVGPGSTRKVMSSGWAVVSGAEGRFMLGVEHSFQSISVSAVHAEKTRPLVERFFAAVDGCAAKNNFYRKQKIDATGRFVNLADVSDEDLILPDDVKRELFRNVRQMIEKWDDYARYGLPGKRGVILAGPPGNGKTLSLKVLAKSLDCTFMWCTPKQIADRGGFADVYEFARELAPTVVLIEDADFFGIDRRMKEFSPTLGDFLNVMDGLEENKGVVTILSSNYAEVLDSALTARPGRFDVKIEIKPPKEAQAFDLIRRTIERRGIALDGDVGVLRQVAKALADNQASGAYVVEAVNYAMILAVERGRGGPRGLTVSAQDFKDSAARILLAVQKDSQIGKALTAEGAYKWGSWYQENDRERQ